MVAPLSAIGDLLQLESQLLVVAAARGTPGSRSVGRR